MNRTALRPLLLVLTLSASSASAQTSATPAPAEPAAAGAAPAEPVSSQRDYALYVSTKLAATPEQLAPLLVVLHGSGQRGAQMVEAWKDLAEREGLIVVGPDSLDPRQWTLPGDGPHFISALVDAIKAKHPVDPRRVYLFGYSAGGLYALSLGLIETEYFAGVASYAAIWKTEADGAAAQLVKRRLPVKLIIGTGDALYDRDLQNAMKQTLRKARIAADLTLIEGQGHGYASVSREVNELAWSFLRDQKLAADPVYVDYGLDAPATAP